MAANWIIGIILMAALWFGSSMFLGVAGGTLVTFLFVTGVLALLSSFPATKPFVRNIPLMGAIIGKFKRNFALGLGIILIMAASVMGTVPFISDFTQPLVASFGMGAPSAITAPGEVSADQCWASADPEIRGSSTTLTLLGVDREANTYTTVGASSYALLESGNVLDSASNSESSFTNTIVGKTYDIYVADNSTYYGDPVTSHCVKGAQETVTVDMHKVATETNMQLTAYDDTGTTELDAAGGGMNAAQEDYNLSMGADETTTIYTKLKNNGANAAFRLCAIATRTTGEVKDLKLVESGWTKKTVPEYLQTAIEVNKTLTVNFTNYDEVWVHEPILLHEWESVKYQWEVESTSTEPAAQDVATPTVTGSDLVIITHLDCAYASDSNGIPIDDYYAHTSTEGNVGLSEASILSPLGKELGTIIELQ